MVAGSVDTTLGMRMPTRENPDNIDWMIIKEEGPYVNGKSHGDYVYYSPDGSVVAKGSYVENRKHGDWFYYSLNGSVVAEGSYANDERSGNWVWYDWYGNVHSTEQHVGSGNSNSAGTSSQNPGWASARSDATGTSKSRECMRRKLPG